MENLTVLELVREVSLLKQAVRDLQGERRILTLEKTAMRAEGGKTLVTLDVMRTSSNYYVDVELLECEGGSAGNLIISDKLRNGFCIHYTGDAKKVTLGIWIQGMMP